VLTRTAPLLVLAATLAGCGATDATSDRSAASVSGLVLAASPQPAASGPRIAPVSTASISPILTREQWGAKPALPGLIAHQPRSIVIHNTDVKRNFARSLTEKLRNLQAFSQSPQTGSGPKRDAWPDIPYHYYIDANGQLGEGREVLFRGDSNTRYALDGHIQVVLEGQFDTETPSAAQLERLTTLLIALQARWQVPKSAIRVHNDLAPTTCPGKTLKAALYGDILPKLPK
jgi:N-acetylmuramoyl-L-alanine amidase